MLPCVGKEKDYSGCVADPCRPEGCAVGEMLCSKASNDDAQAYTGLPGSEERAVCRAALRGGCKVDEHRLEGRKHMSVAESDDECCSVESPGVVQGSKHQITDKRNDYAVSGILCHLSLAQPFGTDQSARYEPHAQQGEEQTCAGGDAEFLLRIDGNVCAHYTIRVTEQSDAKGFGPTFQQKKTVERYGQPSLAFIRCA